MLLAKVMIKAMQKNPNTQVGKMILHSIKSHKSKSHGVPKMGARAVLNKPVVFGYQEYLSMACKDEKGFEAVVRKESQSIPIPVRLFLQDQIRNAAITNDTEKILNALQVVGL